MQLTGHYTTIFDRRMLQSESSIPERDGLVGSKASWTPLLTLTFICYTHQTKGSLKEKQVISYLKSTMTNLYARTLTLRLMKIRVLFFEADSLLLNERTNDLTDSRVKKPTQTSVCFPVSPLDVRCPHSLSDQRLIEACWDFSRTSVLIWQFHQHVPFRSIRSIPLLHVADRRRSSHLIHPPPPHAFKSKTRGCDWSQQVNREHLFTSSTQVNILRIPGSMSELSVCALQRSCQSDVGKQPVSWGGWSEAVICRLL